LLSLLPSRLQAAPQYQGKQLKNPYTNIIILYVNFCPRVGS